MSGQTGPNPRKNWLERYLKIQLSADRRVSAALQTAAKDAEAELLRIADAPGVGAAVRRSQIVTARRAIGRILNDLFQNVRVSIETGQKEAVEAAIDAAARDEQRYLQVMFPSARDRESYLNSAKRTAERNVQAMLVRVTGEQRSLSRKVYHTKALTNGYIDRLVNSHLARGSSVRELATAVRDSIRPDTPGGVAYAAKRLARTEINNAYHAQSITDAQDKPWVMSMEWHLSKSHPHTGCLCETYAKQKDFPVDRVPKKPHPNCFCYVTPKLLDLQTFHKNLIAGQYSGWLNGGAAA